MEHSGPAQTANAPVRVRQLPKIEEIRRREPLWREDDAVQLATAVVCEEAVTKLDENILFGCFDDKLTAAANEEGLRIWQDWTSA